MIIPGNALLALLSSPQDLQGTSEEEGNFGALLTAIESHATSLPDQEEAERRALDSVLQVLMSMFPSCTPANCLLAASAPGTGESGAVSLQPAAGLPLGLLPGLGTAPGLGDTGGINLPPGIVSDGSHDIGQLTFPTLDGQGTGTSPTTAGALENVSWLLHRQERTQDLSGFFMAQPTAALSVSTPTAEAQFVSPGLLQTALATVGERHEAVQETLPPPLSPLSAQTSVSNPDAWDGLSGSLLPLPPGASLSTFLYLRAQDDSLVQTAIALPPSRFSPLSLPSPARGELVSQTVSTERSADTGAPANRVFPHVVFAALGRGDDLTSEMVLQAQHHLGPLPEGSSPLPPPIPAAVDLQQPDASRPLDLTLPPLVEPALAAQPHVAGEDVLQSTRTTLQPAPGHAAPAAPWAVPATAPLTEAAVPLPTVPQTEVAAASAALQSMALAPEDTAFPEYDASPASRRLPEGQERSAATVPSVVPLATDSALPLGSPRAISHTPAAEPAMAVPPSHSLEDMGRPWPRPLPSNTVVLHLEPQELGALLLQVRVSDKRLIASFQAQSPEAEALLRTHLPSLHESLSQYGFEVQPIAITQAAEGFSAHMGAGTGAFAHQHSAFQAFAEEQQAANAGGTQSEVDLQRTPRWPSEQRPRLLDVVI